MIVKLGSWGQMALSGCVIVYALALAWWFVQTPPRSTAERPHPLESLASRSGPEQTTPSVAATPAALAASSPSRASAPRIDIARATPEGDVVVAGRTTPGAKIVLLDRGEILLETQADPATGDFVLLPSRFASGAHELSLRSSTSPDGVQSIDSAVLAFSVSPQKSVIAGNPTHSGSGEPRSSIVGAKSGEAKIVRGDSLWRISRERFGRGDLYPSIYQANSAKIRNPNLIYPDQTLTIP
jgi:nucleoid-associated protein YgaU